MKIELEHPIRFNRETTRHVELSSVDWNHRVVFLADGRWVPFERIVVGDPDEEAIKIRPELAKAEPREAHVCGCGKVYPNAKALGAHGRFCKGVPA
jgi:hypothetical protein